MSFVKGMQDLRAAAVILGYADTEETPASNGAAAAAAAARGGTGKGDNIVLVGFAAVAEPIDVRLLDASGEVGLRIVGRVKILGVQEANQQGFKVQTLNHKP